MVHLVVVRAPCSHVIPGRSSSSPLSDRLTRLPRGARRRAGGEVSQLRIQLFGAFHATADGVPLTGFASDKVRALLAYLAVESDRPHRREALAGLLWPDYPEASARANLRRALANLRTVIADREASQPLLTISRQTVRVTLADRILCDATAFSTALETARAAPERIGELERAVGLYQGPFLEGFSLADSVCFGEWLVVTRERFRQDALSVLRRLATHYEKASQYRKALRYARRQVELEPWQETAQRQVMRLLALEGQRGLAVAQYESCRRILAEQLAVEPSRETTLLCERIRAGDIDGGYRSGGQSMESMSEAVSPFPARLAQEVPSRLPRSLGPRPLLVGGLAPLLVLATAFLQTLSTAWLSTPGRRTAAGGAPGPQPDGQVVLPCPGLSPPQICVHALRTGELDQVTEDLTFKAIDAVSWSPSGDRFALDACPGRESDHAGARHLYSIAVDGSDLRQLTVSALSDHVPAWSPDGEWIAFNRAQELWLVHPDGSSPHRLFGERETLCVGELAWSPNGETVAVLAERCSPGPRPPSREVWVIDRDGEDARVVHTFDRPPDLVSLVWEADGLGIICDFTYVDEGPGLLRIDARGRAAPIPIDVLPVEWRSNYWPSWGRMAD